MKKRILCLALVLCLVLTVLPMAAYAAGTVQFNETEENDSAAKANIIGNGYTILGGVALKDVDFFKFTLSADQTVIVTCSTQLPMYVGIMDSAAEEFLNAIQTSYDTKERTYKGEFSTELTAGTYYLLALNPVQSYTKNEYTLHIEWDSLVNPFVDVSENAAYYDAVLWGNSKGIVSGFTATEFRPNATCTRAQVVTFLWRAKGSPEPTSTNNPFSDVSAVQANGKANPFYKAILWGVEMGITSGYSDGTFRPNDTVTRAQFVTFLWRYEGKPASSTELTFKDASTIAKGYRDAVAWGVENGVIAGYGDNTFRPNATCTRWQVVLFMYRDMADK